jgi:hypothetical protein
MLLALDRMVKTVLPTSVSPDGSVMPDALRMSWPPLVNVGLPARVRLTMSSASS